MTNNWGRNRRDARTHTNNQIRACRRGSITRTGRGVPLLSYPSASAPSPAMFVFVSHFPRIRIRTAAAGQLARGRPLPRSCTAAMRYESERPHPGPALAGRSRRVPRARSVLARAVSAATRVLSPHQTRTGALPCPARCDHGMRPCRGPTTPAGWCSCGGGSRKGGSAHHAAASPKSVPDRRIQRSCCLLKQVECQWSFCPFRATRMRMPDP
jgi:hypothetical protein